MPGVSHLIRPPLPCPHWHVPTRAHAAAIGIELRQCVRGPGEALHSLRDDIYKNTVLEPGGEYVFPGLLRRHHVPDGDMILSPTKCFVARHHVLMARVLVMLQRSTVIPIRVFIPGAAAVTLKRETVAGVLQPAMVLEEVLYAESSANLPEDSCRQLAQLLQTYGDVFSTDPTDLGRTILVQHDILTTPGPPVKQPPCRMLREKQMAADQ